MTKRILVVEDQEDNRQILRDLLASADYEMDEAENGEEALAAVAKQRPDLILMDIQLPIMDGYEATRRIKATPMSPSRTVRGRCWRKSASTCRNSFRKESVRQSCTVRRVSSSSTTTRPTATS